MTPGPGPEQAAAAAGPGATTTTAYGDLTVDVPRDRWVAAVGSLRDELDLDLFDLLTAVDEEDAGFDVVVHLWSTRRRSGLLVRTRLPREAPEVDSLTGVYAGSAWHERHVAEMFGVTFAGHPDLRRLLLPPDLDGHPLRKDFVLEARQTTPWPGRKEPGESDADLDADSPAAAARRRRLLPPGVLR